MEIYSTTQLEKKLKENPFVRCLKRDTIGITRSTKQVAWLIPASTDSDNLTILEYISVKNFKSQIGFQVTRLKQAKSDGKAFAAIGLIDSESEHLCYLVVNKSLALVAQYKVL
jgi:PHD/YefM family antitoxin component YafN of YafNO toxin-antitoxin module